MLFALTITTLFIAASRMRTDTLSTVLHAQNDTKLFIYCTPVQAVLSVVLQVILSRIWGANGILPGLCGAALLTAVWLLPLRASKHLKSK